MLSVKESVITLTKKIPSKPSKGSLQKVMNNHRHVSPEENPDGAFSWLGIGVGTSEPLDNGDDTGDEDMRVSVAHLRENRRRRSLASVSTNPVLVAQQQLERRQTLLRKFRATVRVILLAKTLKSAVQEKETKHEKEIEEDVTHFPFFNVDYYRRDRKVRQLPPTVKNIMSRPISWRSEEEQDMVQRHVTNLNCFEKYPPEVMAKMAHILNYQILPPNRVVVRQGHMPANFYLVLSGSLIVERKEENSVTGIIVNKRLGLLKNGGTFGEIALIHRIPRTATVSTKTETELLWLDSEDFDQFQKEKGEKESWTRSRDLENLMEFQSWPVEERLDCRNHAKVVKYKPNQTIIGDVNGRPECLYFIISGKCRLAEMLYLMWDNLANQSPMIRLTKVAGGDCSESILSLKKSKSHIVKRFVQIMELEKGQYFGAGEDLQRRFVFAVNTVECLEVPHAYLRRKGLLSWVESLKDKLDVYLPSHAYLFDNFVQRATWRVYKKEVLSDVAMKTLGRKARTKLSDVPLSIRTAEKIADWNCVLNTT